MFIKLLEQGYTPIPVYKNSKKPAITENWARFCVEKPTQDEIEQWNESFHSGLINIGITCGVSSKIVVLDIDTNDPAVLDSFPRSPVSRRGAKGEARFFKYSDKIKSINKAGFVDILSNGRQIIIPPSIHPETKRPYEWITPDNLLDLKPEELPDLDMNQVQKVIDKFYNNSVSSKSDGGRNDKLKSIAAAMYFKNNSIQDIATELLRYDSENFTTPLFKDDKESLKGKTPEEKALFFALSVCSSATPSISISKQPEFVKPVEHVSLPYPKPRGMMKQFVDLCNLRSNGNQDALGLGGAIGMMSALCSNRFVIESGGYRTTPNTYIINLAYSSFGKETCQNLLLDLLGRSGLIGAASYRSGTSLVSGLPKQQERLDIWDECSAMLRAMSSTRDDYKSEIVEILSQLYTKARSEFLGFSSMSNGKNHGACYNPHVNILGATTPMGFKGSVNKDMAGKGLLPRFLLFAQNDLGSYKGRIERPGEEKIFNSLMNSINSVLDIPKPIHPSFKSETLTIEIDGKQVTETNPRGVMYSPHILKLSKEAQDRWFDLDEKWFNEKQVNPEGFESAFIGRFSEIMTKVALHDAISLGRKSIEIDSIEWAREVVEVQWHNAAPFYELATAENKQESNVIRIIKYISDAGAPVNKTDLCRKFRYLGSRELNDILKQLVESESICERRESTGGRPLVTYFPLSSVGV